MQRLLTIDELIIDDSFYNYCHQKNEADTLRWEEYVRRYPSQQAVVAEAKEMVLALGAMFASQQAIPGQLSQHPKERSSHSSLVKQLVRYSMAAAAIALTFFIARHFLYTDSSNSFRQNRTAGSASANSLRFKTQNGERRAFVLSDSTRLYLNAGSELVVDKDFGKTNRQVYLSGEALFDVTHNASLPFTVVVKRYQVKVLGTLFNVKAYPNDSSTETSLLRGKVEIQLKNTDQKFVLKPNQKLVTANRDASEPNAANIADGVSGSKELISMLPLTHTESGNEIVETAWSQNKLEILDESLAGMKEKLERWYNVRIMFKDDVVGNYRFTGTFSKESIQQVLEAFRTADYFNYTIQNNVVIISK